MTGSCRNEIRNFSLFAIQGYSRMKNQFLVKSPIMSLFVAYKSISDNQNKGKVSPSFEENFLIIHTHSTRKNVLKSTKILQTSFPKNGFSEKDLQTDVFIAKFLLKSREKHFMQSVFPAV